MTTSHISSLFQSRRAHSARRLALCGIAIIAVGCSSNADTSSESSPSTAPASISSDPAVEPNTSGRDQMAEAAAALAATVQWPDGVGTPAGEKLVQYFGAQETFAPGFENTLVDTWLVCAWAATVADADTAVVSDIANDALSSLDARSASPDSELAGTGDLYPIISAALMSASTGDLNDLQLYSAANSCREDFDALTS